MKFSALNQNYKLNSCNVLIKVITFVKFSALNQTGCVYFRLNSYNVLIKVVTFVSGWNYIKRIPGSILQNSLSLPPSLPSCVCVPPKREKRREKTLSSLEDPSTHLQNRREKWEVGWTSPPSGHLLLPLVLSFPSLLKNPKILPLLGFLLEPDICV